MTVFMAFFVVKIVSGFGTTFYGEYVTTYEFLAFFGIIADMGLFAIAVREMTTKKQNSNDPVFILGNILAMRLILIFSITLIAGIIAQFIPSYTDLVKQGIWITGLSMALTIVAGTLSSVLQARMKIQYFSGSLVIGKTLLAIMIFLLAQYGRQAETSLVDLFFMFLWAGVISNVVFMGLVFYFVRKEIKITLQFDHEYWKKTLKTSLPYGMALVLQTLYLRSDLVLISILLGAEAIGVYGIAARVMESFLILGVFFGQSMLPKLSAEDQEAEKSSRTLYWGMEILLLCSLPIITGVYFFATDIVLLLSTPDFVTHEDFFGADSALMVLIPTVLFAYFNQLFSFSLVSKQKQHLLLGINALGLLTNLGLNLYFLPQYGIMAAAVSTVVCELLVFVLLLFMVGKYFSFRLDITKFLMIFFLNIGIFLLILLTPLKESLILSVAICSLIYLSVLGLFRRRLMR